MNNTKILQTFDYTDNIEQNNGFKYKYKYGNYKITTNKIMTLNEIRNDEKHLDESYGNFLIHDHCKNDLKYVKEKQYDDYIIEFSKGDEEPKPVHIPVQEQDPEIKIKEDYKQNYDDEKRIYVNTVKKFNDVIFKYLDLKQYIEYIYNGSQSPLEEGNIIYSIQPHTKKYECFFRVIEYDQEKEMIKAKAFTPRHILTYKNKKQNKLSLLCYEEWNTSEQERYIPRNEVIEYYRGKDIIYGTFMKIFYGY
jgi:hypothetical protein